MSGLSERARLIAAADAVMAALAIEAVSAGHGAAVVTMRVRSDMVNGAGVAHGGMLFTLADAAFALASNETDAVTLAAGADIVFVASASEGDELTATAVRRALSGRSGLYDVTVTDAGGRVVAEFRGRSRTSAPGR